LQGIGEVNGKKAAVFLRCVQKEGSAQGTVPAGQKDAQEI
jgi:hypothetical protein